MLISSDVFLSYLPYLSPIHPGRVWTTFITLDTVADVIAGNGAARAVNAGATNSQREAGLVLVKVSLFMLLAMFAAFMCEFVDGTSQFLTNTWLSFDCAFSLPSIQDGCMQLQIESHHVRVIRQ